MNDIDFLPAEYRQKHARRRSGNRGVLVILAIVVALATSGAWQLFRYHLASRQLAAVLPHYNQAIAQSGRLASRQAELKPEIAAAELVTYLRHPWPKSQILRALFSPLPEAMNLEKLTVARQADKAPVSRNRPAANPNNEASAPALPPAARDLEMLRARCDGSPVTVTLVGTTSDSAALHRYLGELKQDAIFKHVELRDMASIGSQRQPLFEFHATVEVRPGYGQPEGPPGPVVPGEGADAKLAGGTQPLARVEVAGGGARP